MTTPIIGPGTCPPNFLAPGSYPPDMGARFVESGSEIWRAVFAGTSAYWSGAMTRGATPFQISRDVARWWRLSADRRRPQWASPHEIVFETPVARLRDFSHGASDEVTPTLVLPPQAGHDSCIVDYSPQQSQMKVIRGAGLTRAFSLDWIGATQETKNSGVVDYLEVCRRAIEHIGGPVNLVGDCQGGWLATIYAALHPEDVNTLTIAGAPIDFHAGQPVIGDWVKMLGGRGDLSFYRWVVGLGNGLLKGEYMLNGFVAIRPESEVEKHFKLLGALDDVRYVERYQAFEDWFKHTQDLAGAFYLWIVEHLFRDNKLVRGELDIEGERVDLRRIECPLFMLAGVTDHITPPDQVFAAANAVGTPEELVVERTAESGHLGLFMSRAALREHWPPLLAGVFEHSRPGARRERAEREAREEVPLPVQPTVPAP